MTDLGLPGRRRLRHRGRRLDRRRAHRRGAPAGGRVRRRAHPGVDPQRRPGHGLRRSSSPATAWRFTMNGAEDPYGLESLQVVQYDADTKTYTDIGELITDVRGPDRAPVVVDDRPAPTEAPSPAARRPRGDGPLRRHRRARRALVRHPGGRHLRAHRSERRRQDDVLQRRQPHLRADARRACASTATTSWRMPAAPHRQRRASPARSRTSRCSRR